MFARILDTPAKRIAAAVVGFVLLVGAVAVFALGGGEEDAAPTTTTTVPTTTTTEAPKPVAPLTGVAGDYGDKLDRPALVVKIDNDDKKARPQVGLNSADIVYEERVEGSVTRFAAIFHSHDSVPVGPVRSTRTTDIAIVNSLNRPFYAWSGGNPSFAARIRRANIVDVGYDARTGEYFREPSRPRPHNLMLRSTDAIMHSIAGSGPPPQLFHYREPDQEIPYLQPAEGAAVSYGGGPGGAPTEWRWNGKGWARYQNGTPHVDTAGHQVAPMNVIIQFVAYVPTTTPDQFGVLIPEADLVGTGPVWVLTGGGKQPHGVVKGTWAKGNLEGKTALRDADGKPIRLTPGTTWVVLPAAGGARLL